MRLYHFLCHPSYVSNKWKCFGRASLAQVRVKQCAGSAFPAFPHFPDFSCSTTLVPLIFLSEPRMSMQQHQSQSTTMPFPSYAMPWCREVTLILMNSFQDFQCDYFSPDDLRLRSKSSEKKQNQTPKIFCCK